jgi:hypothetical protein
VVFHREPFFPKKYRFANSVIDELNLTVYDFPPIQTEVQQEGDEVEVMNYYQVGSKTCALPTGIRAPKHGEQFVCGLKDIYMKPTGTFNYPFDLVFHGHRSADVDPIYGAIPINSDIVNNIGFASVAFPFRLFSDAELWRYIEENNVPIHHERYEKTDDGWKEREDKSSNQDYMTACTLCMNKNGPNSVRCPKADGLYVANVSNQLRWAGKADLTYMKQ